MVAVQNKKSLLDTLADSVVDQNAINFWLQKVNKLWSSNQALGKIIEKKQVAHDMVSLTLQCNHWVEYGHAGQHHPVFVTIKGCRHERSYSLTTNPQAKTVTLTVKKMPEGEVSSWLVDSAQVGDILELGQPFGEMQLPEQCDKLVLVAAGSGITPMYSLIQQARSTQFKQPIQLLYWVKKIEDAAFEAEFAAFAQENPNFSFTIFHTQETPADPRLNAEHLHLVSQLENATVYACGPSGFVGKANEVFATAKVFNSEAFSLMPMDSSDDTGFVNVTLTRSNKTVSIPKGQPILVGLEQADLKPIHGCRMGICNKCVCHKSEGAVKNLVNGMENHEPSTLKICVNAAQTDLVIDL